MTKNATTLTDHAPGRSLSITVRTALLSWLVTVMTLGVFVAFIVPEQKRIYLESLQSKARGISVSLRDVTAGAAINEDYSSVVDNAIEMLNGDPSLSYIVITRNDGFSLINDRSGWRVDPAAGPEWHPNVREARGAIATNSLSLTPVYHYSTPFDYSAIEWGWVHVGLSLDDYNANVATLYRATVALSIVCILLSLIASVIYAKRLVQPIIALQNVVQRVARGDFSPRATVHRSDEIGALATSVNTMTDALLQRDRILGSVRRSAETLVASADWAAVLPRVLADIGTAAGVSSISVYESVDDPLHPGQARLRHGWVDPELPAELHKAPPEKYAPATHGFDSWHESLHQGKITIAHTTKLPEPQRDALAARGVKSIVVVPIAVNGKTWGTLNLLECRRERAWESAELDSLRAIVDLLGATIVRQRAQAALIEANNTLEHRVTERTRELVSEVEAKEQARAELAAAQQQLIAASRQAGMAEIASGVLHNVGNVLNSVNVSSSLVTERLMESQIRSLRRLTTLVEENLDDFPRFIAEDPRGQKLAEYLVKLTQAIDEERDFLLKENEQLTRNIEHIKDIVSMQQSYAKVSGFQQQVQFTDVIEDALQINATGFARHHIKVVRDYRAHPSVVIDKHKVLQICINLFQNAKNALTESDQTDRRIIILLEQTSAQRIRFTITDNGIGIPADNLTRIFAHGFTTRRQGHGFGLHSGANHAREMGGTLTAHSDGPGQGATFVLELPLKPPR